MCNSTEDECAVFVERRHPRTNVPSSNKVIKLELIKILTNNSKTGSINLLKTKRLLMCIHTSLIILQHNKTKPHRKILIRGKNAV